MRKALLILLVFVSVFIANNYFSNKRMSDQNISATVTEKEVSNHAAKVELSEHSPQNSQAIKTPKIETINGEKHLESAVELTPEQALEQLIIERMTYEDTSYYDAFQHMGIPLSQIETFYNNGLYDARSAETEKELLIHIDKFAQVGVIEDHRIYCNSYGCEVMLSYHGNADPESLAEFESKRLHDITHAPTQIMTKVREDKKPERIMYAFVSFNNPIESTTPPLGKSFKIEDAIDEEDAERLKLLIERFKEN